MSARSMLSRSVLRPALRSQQVPCTTLSLARGTTHAFSTSQLWQNEQPAAPTQDADAELMQRVKDAIKEAMKAKDTLKTTVLRSILSEHQYSQKQKGNNPASKIAKLMTKAIARRKDAAKQFRAAKPPREDLADQEEKEAAVLETFLPPAASK